MRVVFRHYAFLGQSSIRAAEASECAAEQGRFWPYHDKLMAGQGVRNGASFSVENLRRFAAEIGLQQEAFTTCLDSGRHTARVQAETAAGTAKGVNSTPTIFVNGQVIRGVPTFPDLQRAVLAALTAAR